MVYFHYGMALTGGEAAEVHRPVQILQLQLGVCIRVRSGALRPSVFDELRSAASSVFLWCSCRNGSVVAHLWLRLWVPSSRVETVNVQRLNQSVFRELQRFSDVQISRYQGLHLLLPSLSFTGNTPPVHSHNVCSLVFAALCRFVFFYFPETNPKVIDLFQATFGMISFLSL